MAGNDYSFDVVLAADLLMALTHPMRVQVLRLLLDDERDVGAMARELSVKQPSLSRHLAVLRGLQLVSTRRDGAMVYYVCRLEGVRLMMALLGRIEHQAGLQQSGH